MITEVCAALAIFHILPAYPSLPHMMPGIERCFLPSEKRSFDVKQELQVLYKMGILAGGLLPLLPPCPAHICCSSHYLWQPSGNKTPLALSNAETSCFLVAFWRQLLGGGWGKCSAEKEHWQRFSRSCDGEARGRGWVGESLASNSSWSSFLKLK